MPATKTYPTLLDQIPHSVRFTARERRFLRTRFVNLNSEAFAIQSTIFSPGQTVDHVPTQSEAMIRGRLPDGMAEKLDSFVEVDLYIDALPEEERPKECKRLGIYPRTLPRAECVVNTTKQVVDGVPAFALVDPNKDNVNVFEAPEDIIDRLAWDVFRFMPMEYEVNPMESVANIATALGISYNYSNSTSAMGKTKALLRGICKRLGIEPRDTPRNADTVIADEYRRILRAAVSLYADTMANPDATPQQLCTACEVHDELRSVAFNVGELSAPTFQMLALLTKPDPKSAPIADVRQALQRAGQPICGDIATLRKRLDQLG